MRFVIGVSLPLLFAIGAPSFAADRPQIRPAMEGTDRRIGGMKVVLGRIVRELNEARKKDDIRRINCLTLKLNLVKGLVKASQRAQMALVDALAGVDSVSVVSYTQKVSTYGDSVDEVAKSLSECLPTESAPDGMSLVYIRPEETELVSEEINPWAIDAPVGSGAEGYPVVPPTSPFR